MANITIGNYEMQNLDASDVARRAFVNAAARADADEIDELEGVARDLDQALGVLKQIALVGHATAHDMDRMFEYTTSAEEALDELGDDTFEEVIQDIEHTAIDLYHIKHEDLDVDDDEVEVGSIEHALYDDESDEEPEVDVDLDKFSW